MNGQHLDDTMNTCSVYFEENHDTSHVATATHSHWVHYTVKAGVPVNFAEYTEGNRVEAHLGGKDYFAALLAAFGQAQSTIYITGWQVNWDAQLAEGVRLVDALLAAVSRSAQLKVYIMPWKNPPQLETYSEATERVFAALNGHVKRRAFHVLRAGSMSGIFFSHHQKCVIVDERVAFVGGIDLAYGRYDDNYGLQADAAGRQGMNMYNPCVPVMVQGRGYNPMEEYAIPATHPEWQRNPDALARARKREAASVANILDAVLTQRVSQSPGAAKSSTYLDAAIQPRMPWQDYHMEIEGPVVYDLLRNFVLRWNSYPEQYPLSLLQTQVPLLAMPSAIPARAGSCQVQVLRSASLKMCRKEYRAMPKVAREASATQRDVMESMKLLIGKAEHYIYIENQFFVSAFGESSVKELESLSPVADSINPSMAAMVTRGFPDKDAPENRLAEWLGDKIKRVIIANNPEPFHIYIMLPVSPEGRLDDPTIVAQIHLTRQSLVFGSHSLLNRIRRSLWIKQQLEADAVPRCDWSRRFAEYELACGINYQNIDVEACYAFVTLLNLRDHGELSGQPVTEQIYVHSKLMIVDDRWVLVGSANINDRSLLGTGDSELAVMIADTESGVHDIDGTGTPAPYRMFARELRQNAWRKWMGSAAEECGEALDKPALKTSWEKIQTLALGNAEIYESVFSYIPRDHLMSQEQLGGNYSGKNKQGGSNEKAFCSIWPVLRSNQANIDSGRYKMPFSVIFWKEYHKHYFGVVSRLGELKGYFTRLAVNWGAGENNLIPYNMRLIAEVKGSVGPDKVALNMQEGIERDGDFS